MKPEHTIILKEIEDYLKINPSERFGQALTNLKIIGFADEKHSEHKHNFLKDIYYDTDVEIILRIRENQKSS